MRRYAGIGSRETPWETLEKMTEIATYLEKHKWVLRSGGAQGADQAFEAGLRNGNNAQIFYPQDRIPLWTNVFTDMFHPAPDKLSGFVRKLMDRNAMQILGVDGNSPVEMVICWTKDGKASGGTGQALRIAEYYNIPVFNLKNEGALDELREFIKNGNT